MTRAYQPKRFFRDAPNRLLKQYFAGQKVLADIDFDALGETKIDPLYEAWLTLPGESRKAMEQDFQDIESLASEAGTKAIIDEARWHGEDLAAQFSELDGHHAHAFWTFLERRDYLRGALYFHHADSMPESYWRKRKNIPRKPAGVDAESIDQLKNGISAYFHKKEGRGHNCKVECFRRDDRDYFFAYPEDYAQAGMEWESKELQRRARHPAFEIIFVYSEPEGTLDILLRGDKQPVPMLQALFAKTILKAELPPDQSSELVYELNSLRSRSFQFTYSPDSGIVDVLVKKLQLEVIGKRHRITLEADPTFDKHAVFDLLEKVTVGIPMAQISVKKVGITVKFAPTPGSMRRSTRSFDIGYTNYCSLKHDGRDLLIRQMLAESGIEPREPEQPHRIAA
jgi:hypothetical protein